MLPRELMKKRKTHLNFGHFIEVFDQSGLATPDVALDGHL